jgi:hypothetical protein
MFWMGSCLIVLFFSVILGPYRLEADAETQDGTIRCRFSLVSAGRILGIKWNPGCLSLAGMGKRIGIRRSGIEKSCSGAAYGCRPDQQTDTRCGGENQESDR